MSTMREVAARAGVSAKTVSRVFNQDPHVQTSTRERVERAMRDLNYVPNALATTFRSGRSPVIGVAVPDVVDPFFASIIRAVDEAARARSMSTLVTNLGDDAGREHVVLESLLSRQLSGLVIAPVSADQSWLKRWLEHTPIVFVDRIPSGISADTFTEDDESGSYLATKHLMNHGHERIAFLGDSGYIPAENNRLRGYARALGEAGIEVDEQLVVRNASNRAAAAEAMGELWALNNPPTAVFSANARCSMFLVPALRAHRAAFVGFGDFPLADLLQPSLTVIDQDPAKLGSEAARRIFDRLDHPSRRFRRRNLLEVSLVERESCVTAVANGASGQRSAVLPSSWTA